MSATSTMVTGTGEREMSAPPMKAIVARAFGPPDTLKLEDVERPAIDPDRMLVRVRAASVNPADYHSFHGGLMVMLMNRSRRPTTLIQGTDVAGVVEEVGANVTDLRPGDEVFGGAPGALAEYASARNVVPKPAGLTFEQAAAIPIAGLTALQGLRDKVKLQAGQTILINGAAGGVGTFSVQIAKALGAEVTAVCSTRNIDLVRSLGADHVIDYTREDFARSEKRYDVVFDIVGNRSLGTLRRVATPEGTICPLGGSHERGHGARGLLRPMRKMARAVLQRRFVSQKIVIFIAQFNKPDLLALRDLVESGALTPVIDRTYPLSGTPEAFRYLQTGHAPAKIVITV